MTEFPKQYDAKAAQERWLRFWDEQGFFHSDPDSKRKPYTIVIPPPNVTGALHMGHALNNTLQDVLIRYHRAKGDNTEWMPGTDHAGIATQAVVERLIFAQEKKTRRDLSREELVRRIWEWKEIYEKRILGQLKQLGCSCDWPRTRFTFDEGNNRAVRETFFKWFKDGYIYGVCSYGQLRCIKTATGERVWETMKATRGALTPEKVAMKDDPDTSERWSNAFLIRHENRYFLFNEQGDLIIAKLSPKGYEEVSRTHLIDPTNAMAGRGRKVVWMHPAFADRCVFAKNDKELVCVSLAK
jgi:valyl-tRNA synthetase